MAIDFFFRAGDSLVTRARNDCVAQFLANPVFTHLFWIDGDIGFSPEAAMRLLLSDHDVAAGVYPLKREEWPAEGVPEGTTRKRFDDLYARYPVNTDEISGDVVELTVDADGFMRVSDAPTGFMVIKRKVFDLLIEKYPDYKYKPDWPEGNVPEGGFHYRFFDTMIDPISKRLLSEDYAFCRLLQHIGQDIYRRRQLEPHPYGPAPLHRRLRRHAEDRPDQGHRRHQGSAHRGQGHQSSQDQSLTRGAGACAQAQSFPWVRRLPARSPRNRCWPMMGEL